MKMWRKRAPGRVKVMCRSTKLKDSSGDLEKDRRATLRVHERNGRLTGSEAGEILKVQVSQSLANRGIRIWTLS